MKKVIFKVVLVCILLTFVSTFSLYSFSKPVKTYKIATTTSIYDSGFLSFVVPEFEKRII